MKSKKTLLESVLPKTKIFRRNFISPNHEFVHQFDLGTIERPLESKYKTNRTVTENYNLAEKFKDFGELCLVRLLRVLQLWEVRSFVDNETVTGSDKERNALVRERRKAANDLFYKFVGKNYPMI